MRPLGIERQTSLRGQTSRWRLQRSAFGERARSGSSLSGLRRATRASTYPTGWRFKHIRTGLYRLCACDVACPAARLAFAVGFRPSVAHDPASLARVALRSIILSYAPRSKRERAPATSEGTQAQLRPHRRRSSRREQTASACSARDSGIGCWDRAHARRDRFAAPADPRAHRQPSRMLQSSPDQQMRWRSRRRRQRNSHGAS